jgi:GT2 family glycosyltransferase
VRKVKAARNRAASARQSTSFHANLIVNQKERQYYVLSKKAKKYEDSREWKAASQIRKKIIDELGGEVAADEYIRLSKTLSEQGLFNEALILLNRAASSYPKTKNAATNDDLRAWLKISNEKAEVSLKQCLKNVGEYKQQIKLYNADKKRRKKTDLKIAVFCAISGGYDTLKPPMALNSKLDYFVFTDAAVESFGIYNIKPLPYLDSEKTRSARFVKTNPHYILADYDIAVWVDANLLITGNIYPIVDSVIKSKKPFGAMKHAVRNSPYQEMDVCIAQNRDDADVINEQRKAYKKERYNSYELIESNVLVYDLRDKRLDAFLNEWWNQIDRYSYRDQLSINYALDKHNIKWHHITSYPNTARNHPEFALMMHGADNKTYPKLVKKLNAKLEEPNRGVPYIKIKKERLKNQKVSITAVVCVHNAFDDVKRCLQSVKTHRSKKFNLIIVDDGSDKVTEEYLERFQKNNTDWVTLIRHSKPAGYTKSANVGLKASNADFTIILNSDTVVTDGWAEKMADVAIKNKGVGIVGPLSNAASWQSVPDIESQGDQTAINTLPYGLDSEDMNNYCEKWSMEKDIPLVPLVHGFCIGITRDVVDAIGGFDEKNFSRGYGEENDYCFRAANAGFQLAYATHTYVFHAKSKSFATDERVELMDMGMATLVELHGQRRINRAVQALRQNHVLTDLRQKFGKLYA